MTESSLKDKIKYFPREPGVYLMKDNKGKIIYVGKAKNLKSRVGQYWQKEADSRYQIRFLLKKIYDVDYLITKNESEALLLENSLIKKHKPRYNIFLKDDKSYISIKLTIKDKFPKIFPTRSIKKDGQLYFGPYTRADSCRHLLDFLQQNFKLRTCSDHDFNHRSRPCLEYQINRCTAPCVDYVSEKEYHDDQIEPVLLFLKGKSKELIGSLKEKMEINSEKLEFEKASHYRDLMDDIDQLFVKQNVVSHLGLHQDIIHLHRIENRALVAVLSVREGVLIDSHYFPLKSIEPDQELLENFLSQYYLSHEFIPDEILVSIPLPENMSLTSVLSERKGKQVQIRLPQRGEKKELLELARQNALAQFSRMIDKQITISEQLQNLKNKLGLNKLPRKIEGYDISNIQGKFAVGSQVVFVNGDPDKSLYRKYKIKTKETPDDYQMMYEVLSRRFQNENKEDLPNLIMIDGGRGQLNIALKVLEELKINQVEVIGVAKGQGEGVRAKGEWKEKKEEEIYLPNRKNPIKLKTGSIELKLIQRVRDESHRFAIQFHRKLRDQKIDRSFLNDIKGLGPVIKKRLFEKFKHEKGIRSASIEELCEVKGVSYEMSKQILSSKK